ncbi:hypothetical protein [Streptomyces sp. AC495_CC817]|uniref:hypothetical protein n=1 Tax=Streptomyces sp. AC495_CC817 TaxID=2823900 RepID=UPI001C25F440|nr:hypothetical protein [Streptomyces sp. AC495_CC817]
MTIDEKVVAVEEFLDWRDESGATDPLTSSLERWRSTLQQAEDEQLLHELRRDAEFAKGDPDECVALVDRLVGRRSSE